MRRGHQATDAEVTRLKSEVSQCSVRVGEARHVADKNRSNAVSMQRCLEEAAGREAQLCRQLNAWKDQWSKLHPELQVVCRDVDHLKRRCDHHDAAIHGAQQAAAANSAQVGELSTVQAALRGDVHALRAELGEAARSFLEVRDGLHEAVVFSNNLHSNVEESGRLLRKATEDVDDLAKKHGSTLEELERTKEEVSVTRTRTLHHAKTVSLVQKELERAQEDITVTRTELESTSTHVDGLKGELGKTKKTVDRLDTGVEFCRAGFTGLQKGLQATGVHLQGRHSVVLPSLGSTS